MHLEVEEALVTISLDDLYANSPVFSFFFFFVFPVYDNSSMHIQTTFSVVCLFALA